MYTLHDVKTALYGMIVAHVEISLTTKLFFIPPLIVQGTPTTLVLTSLALKYSARKAASVVVVFPPIS